MDILTLPLPIQFVLVMLAVALLDACWTFYIAAVAKKTPGRAAMWSSLIMLFGAFVALSYVQRPILVLAAGIGAFVGTYIATLIASRKSTGAPA